MGKRGEKKPGELSRKLQRRLFHAGADVSCARKSALEMIDYLGQAQDSLDRIRKRDADVVGVSKRLERVDRLAMKAFDELQKLDVELNPDLWERLRELSRKREARRSGGK